VSTSAPAALPVPDAAGIPAWLTVLIAAPCGLLVGLGSVAVQILVPYAAHLAPDATRGRVVSNVMSGLMLGIMLARQVASLVTEALSWHAVFALSAAVMAGLAVVLRLALPPRQPAPGLRYAELLASMGRLALRTPVLQRHALYQACLFAAFSLFWKAAALFLADTFHLSQNGIALFALVGVTGAIAAPIAGRTADRGWSRPATGLAMAVVAGALLVSAGRLGLCLRRLVPGNVGRASPAGAGLLLLPDRTA
jgi:predicted MFS family arabinose efflux permease